MRLGLFGSFGLAICGMVLVVGSGAQAMASLIIFSGTLTGSGTTNVAYVPPSTSKSMGFADALAAEKVSQVDGSPHININGWAQTGGSQWASVGGTLLLNESSTELVQASLTESSGSSGWAITGFTLTDSLNNKLFSLSVDAYAIKTNSTQTKVITLVPGQYTLQWGITEGPTVGFGGTLSTDFSVDAGLPEPVLPAWLLLCAAAFGRGKRRWAARRGREAGSSFRPMRGGS